MPWKSLNIVSQDYHPPTVVESISYELWDAGLQDVVTQAEAEDGNICLVDELSANTHTKCRYFICSFSPSKLQRMLVVSSSIGFIKALITPYIKLHSGMILSFHASHSHAPPPPFLTFSIHSDCHKQVFRMVKEGYSDLETLETNLYIL